MHTKLVKSFNERSQLTVRNEQVSGEALHSPSADVMYEGRESKEVHLSSFFRCQPGFPGLKT